MPVQYPAGLLAEHHHTRRAASLFDVSHMGQLRLVGADAAAALETLLPVDVIGLASGRQRYGLLLNDAGGIIDDLMFVNTAPTVMATCSWWSTAPARWPIMAHIQAGIGQRCEVSPCPSRLCWRLQGRRPSPRCTRLAPGVDRLVFMTGGSFDIDGAQAGAAKQVPCYITRSGYTGEDGFENLGAPGRCRRTGARPAGPA